MARENRHDQRAIPIFMEGKIEWHGVAPNKEQMKQALDEIWARLV